MILTIILLVQERAKSYQLEGENSKLRKQLEQARSQGLYIFSSVN